MFAKVFGQIFDSSIAEDYNCRRMFMDLLVLADAEGNVDMTHEAISRRTNVPIDEVRKYIHELSQPDPASRSKRDEGRRLIPLDSARDWGWTIVNYKEYRQLRDQEARREYFREQKRRQRSCNKPVQDIMVDNGANKVDTGGRCQSVTSASSSVSSSKKGDTKGKTPSLETVLAYVTELGLPNTDGHYYFDKWLGNGFTNGGRVIKDWQAVIRSHQRAGYLPSQKQQAGPNGFQKPKPPDFHQDKLNREYQAALERRRKQ